MKPNQVSLSTSILIFAYTLTLNILGLPDDMIQEIGTLSFEKKLFFYDCATIFFPRTSSSKFMVYGLGIAT